MLLGLSSFFSNFRWSQESGGREELSYFGYLSDVCERYDDTREYMSKLSCAGSCLNRAESELLLKAFKESYAERLRAWETLTNYEHQFQGRGQDKAAASARKYSCILEADMLNICNSFIDLLDQTLIPQESEHNTESSLSFREMKRDFSERTEWIVNRGPPQKSQLSCESLLDRDEYILFAKLAEQADRYDEMILCMSSVGRMEQELNADERRLLEGAYKNAVQELRHTWLKINSVIIKHEGEGKYADANHAKAYRSKIGRDVQSICDSALDVVDHMIGKASDATAQVFCQKVKADYHRYSAEVKTGAERERQAKYAAEAYDTALKVAQANLPICSVNHLGLALNYSVFVYEVLNQKVKAVDVATETYDKAVEHISSVDDPEVKLVMELMRENLMKWDDAARQT